MGKYNKVFINTTGCNDWILKIIADDIASHLKDTGVAVRKGPREDYQGEDIVYHMWWRVATPIKNARVNSVFITHTDDELKERDLVRMKDSFDSFITMSKEDALFLIDLGFDSSRVFGLDLPVRNTFVRPISLGIFSRCYNDGRKNEEWLYDYCKSHSDSKLVVFVFIGDGWGEFVNNLSLIGCSFEWHNISREMPYEYMYQQLKLSNIDYYLYMGMDGGAMGTYDAYAMGANLCVTDDGYHKSIPDRDFRFETKEQFFDALDAIICKQKRRIDFFSSHSTTNYVASLLRIWMGEYSVSNEIIENRPGHVLNKRRKNYFPFSLNRIKQFVSSFLYRKGLKS